MSKIALIVGALAVLMAIGLLWYRHLNVNPGQQEVVQQPPAQSTPPTALPRDIPPVTQAPMPGLPQVPQVPVQPQQQPSTTQNEQTRAAQQQQLAQPTQTVPAPSHDRPVYETAPSNTHVVAPGDSLWKISMKYYGSPKYIDRLVEVNRLSSASHIKVGQSLSIPAYTAMKKVSPPDADHESVPVETVNRTPRAQPARTTMPPTLAVTVNLDDEELERNE